MKKKTYIKPSVKAVKIEHKCHILVGSDNYGLDEELQDTEVEIGW